MKYFKAYIFIFLALLLANCEKVSENQAIINGKVFHHEWTVPGVKVYLRIGVTEYPGPDSKNYSDSMIVKGDYAEFSFRKLSPGDYYIMAYGYDTLFRMPVRGYRYIRVNDPKEIVTINLEVGE